jgi:hypothetical protein
MALSGFSQAASQDLQIGIIDFYGLNRVSPVKVREALTFEEGDSISFAGEKLPRIFTDSERRLLKVPGVVRAHTNVTCCEDGRVIVYVGIEERGAPTMRLRGEPGGKARLADDLVAAGEDFLKALMLAVQSGDAGEDRSLGHAFRGPGCGTPRQSAQRSVSVASGNGALEKRGSREAGV